MKNWGEEEDGNISIVLPPCIIRTGKEWIDHLITDGHRVCPTSRMILESGLFVPTDGKVKIVTIVRGNHIPDDRRITEAIEQNEGHKYGLDLTLEDVCRMRDLLSRQDLESMGFRSIIVMHEVVEAPDGFRLLLRLDVEDGVAITAANQGYNRDGLGFALATITTIN